MPYYIRAHYSDGSVILGNLDGQASLRFRRPERCVAWTRLGTPLFRVKPSVHHWTLTNNSDQVLFTKLNPQFKESN